MPHFQAPAISFLDHANPRDAPISAPLTQEIPLCPKVVRRFYLPLILHTSLKTVFRKAAALRTPNIESHHNGDDFQNFVNKLGHICDSAKGGNTITAFGILQHGNMRYYFTSNRREDEDYQRTSLYVSGILRMLGEVRDDEVGGCHGGRDESLPVFAELLRSIIGFNQSRVKGYMFAVAENLEFCIEFLQRTEEIHATDQGQEILRGLRGLEPFLQFLECRASTLEQFTERSKSVIEALMKTHTPSFAHFLRQRAQNNPDRDAPWVKVHHSIGRLLSYHHAIGILLRARRNWPQLFVDFEVHWFPSSDRRQIRIPRAQKLDASVIIGKMTSNQDEIKLYRGFASELERAGMPLNKTINAASSGGGLAVYVHAEMNLLDNILRLQREGEAPQFFYTPYIGVSKPTCRLCELYFAHHPSGIATRESHRGLYSAWCMPGVFTPQADRERLMIFNHIIPVVRNEIFTSLREKFAMRRPNDSWDTPSRVIPAEIGSVDGRSGAGEVEEMVPWRGQVSVCGGMEELDQVQIESESQGHGFGEVLRNASDIETRENLSPTPALTEESTAEGDSDDDEGGGARL